MWFRYNENMCFQSNILKLNQSEGFLWDKPGQKTRTFSYELSMTNKSSNEVVITEKCQVFGLLSAAATVAGRPTQSKVHSNNAVHCGLSLIRGVFHLWIWTMPAQIWSGIHFGERGPPPWLQGSKHHFKTLEFSAGGRLQRFGKTFSCRRFQKTHFYEWRPLFNQPPVCRITHKIIINILESQVVVCGFASFLIQVWWIT